MRVKTENFSDQNRRGWCDVAVPYQQVAGHPERAWYRLPERGWLATRGRDIGTHSAIIHLYGEWSPREVVAGELTPAEDLSKAPTARSDWVSDEIDDLIPIPMVQIEEAGEIITGTDFFYIEMVENNAAREVWHGWGRVTGTMLVFDAWTYIYSEQDAVRVEYTFTNSDPRKPDLTQRFAQLGIRTGEFFAMDFREHWGLSFPAQDPDGKWVQIVSGQRSLDDSQQIAFSGWLLCLPKGLSSLNLLSGDSQSSNLLSENSQRRLASLVAHLKVPGRNNPRGPVLGCSLDWQGHWGAFGVTPRVPRKGSDFRGFYLAHLKTVVDMYDKRPWNLQKSAPTTGAQEDFGACKGAGVVTGGDPLIIEQLYFAVSEHMRPFHNREVDGSPVLAANHPKLVTWSQRPFNRLSPDADDLGKGFFPLNGTGYGGEDDQHRSQNNFNAAYALTGSYWLESILKDFLEIDYAMAHEWYRAPRAQGRLFAAWANILRFLGPTRQRRLLDHMAGRMAVSLQKWPGRLFVGNPDTPIRVLDWTRDLRVLPEPDGTPAPAWVVWQHAIATMGYYAASLQVPEAESGPYFEMAREMAELVTRYGCFHDGTSWRCCTSIRYLMDEDEGKALPASEYGVDSTTVSFWDAFWTWTLPAVLICEKITSDETLRARAKSIREGIGGEGPPDWQSSEWWAVLEHPV